jgi:hypothetical protein
VGNANVVQVKWQKEASARSCRAEALRSGLSAYSASEELSKAAQTTLDAALKRDLTSFDDRMAQPAEFERKWVSLPCRALNRQQLTNAARSK